MHIGVCGLGSLMKYLIQVKHLVLAGICAAGLTACASTSPAPFGPAYGSDFGYRNTQLQSDRFRISYTSRDAYESRDFALLRAAQIASNEGYSHFRIVDGYLTDNGPNRIGTGIGVGLGGGRYNRSHVNVGVGDIARTLKGRKVTETIEVILLASAPPNDPAVYSAQSLIRNIVPPQSQPAVAPPAPTP